MPNLTLTLYNNHSAEHVVNKSRDILISLSGALKENTNMEHVVVTIPYFTGYASVNYAYIPEFKRYYFVSVDVLNGYRLRLNMNSDPISSFWNEYKNSPCIAKRSSSDVNPNIEDNRIPFNPQPKYIFRKMNTGFTPSSNGYCYVLTLGGR